MTVRMLGWVMAFAVIASACHSEVENVPLTDQKIYFSDKFFDVKAIGPDHALIVGYGGKILETKDGGATFTRLQSGTDLALYEVAAVGSRLWISGQEGLILHSADGGQTWQKQASGTTNYLFSIFFVNENRGWAVGDRSIILSTVDGGKTWTSGTIQRSFDETDPDLALAMQDPVLYDVQFLNEQTGWVVGEFGRIYRTDDGGQSWAEQQNTLMSEATGIVDPMDIPTFFGVQVVNAREIYVAGLEGRVGRTQDGGTTWAFEPMKLEFPIADPLYESYIAPDGAGWAVGAAGEVVTRPAGETEWRRAELGNLYTWIRAIDFADPQKGWMVGGYGTILRTEDGGKSWSARNG